MCSYLKCCFVNLFPILSTSFFCWYHPAYRCTDWDKSFFSSYLSLPYFCISWKVGIICVILAILFVYCSTILSGIIPRSKVSPCDLELLLCLRRGKNLMISANIFIKKETNFLPKCKACRPRILIPLWPYGGEKINERIAILFAYLLNYLF